MSEEGVSMGEVPELAYASGPVAEDPAWTNLAYTWLVDGVISATYEVRGDVETYVFAGPCPRCHQRSDRRWPATATAVRGLDRPMAGTYKTMRLACHCGDARHLGAPAGATGCGAFFAVPALVVHVAPPEEAQQEPRGEAEQEGQREAQRARGDVGA